MILIFVAAVLASLVLERQELRHNFEITLEYRRMQKPMPKLKPRIPLLESWLNIGLGMLLLFLGAFGLYSNFLVLKLMPGTLTSSELEISGVMLASGIALILLGVKLVKLHRGAGDASN